MAHKALYYYLPLQPDTTFLLLLTTFQLHKLQSFPQTFHAYVSLVQNIRFNPDIPIPGCFFRSLVKYHFKETSHHPMYGGCPCSIYLLNLLPVSPH